MTDALDLAHRLVIADRIAELRRWARWYKAQPDPDRWADLAADHAAELRALVRLSRLARSVARKARESEAAALAAGDHYFRASA